LRYDASELVTGIASFSLKDIDQVETTLGYTAAVHCNTFQPLPNSCQHKDSCECFLCFHYSREHVNIYCFSSHSEAHVLTHTRVLESIKSDGRWLLSNQHHPPFVVNKNNSRRGRAPILDRATRGPCCCCCSESGQPLWAGAQPGQPTYSFQIRFTYCSSQLVDRKDK
jgi:hypothetical protein